MSLTPRWIAVALALSVLAVAAPGASAQSPSQAGYGETPVVALPQSGVAGIHRIAGNDGSGDPRSSGAAAAVGAGEPGAALTPGSGAAPAETLDTSSGRLPFTGMDLGLIGVAAAVLLAAGIALRRATTPA